jgi:hypothetical protein
MQDIIAKEPGSSDRVPWQGSEAGRWGERGSTVIGVETQAEPIPGYRLLERLGEGGFGEVWKARAPGGLLKAIKIVYGCLQAAGGDEMRVRQELKALDRVKTVRHPFILSLERYDIIDGRLFIVMELADRSLWDRFRECQAQGFRGIPREELLRYLEETAEALDLMNTEYQLQHLDIKPQNLFLLYNHIKIGDFGLVKDLEGVRAQATSGVTAAYASPETYEGVISRFCDQYSLAIVYQELLTGQMPFDGTNLRQLMMQHLSATPNVSPLPPGDREPIARALSKKPEDRHASCGELVRALRGAPAKDLAATPTVQVTGTAHLNTPPQNAPATTVRIAEPAPAVPERPEVTGDGVLFPALVIGLGGVGLAVVRQLRKALHKRCGPPSHWPHIRLLQIDTDAAAHDQAAQGEPETVLSGAELLLARLHRPAHYLRLGVERQALQHWLPVGMLSRLARDQCTTGGWRPLGRLAFVSNYAPLSGRLRAELDACLAPGVLEEAARQTGLALRSNRPRVYVVTSLAGGTGSGMFLDLAYELRAQLQLRGYSRAEVIGLFLLPAVDKTPSSPLALGNTFAALTELNHFATSDEGYSAGCQDRHPASVGKAPPYSRCILLPLASEGDNPESLQELSSLTGDFLCRELTTPLGRSADQCRAAHAAARSRTPYQTFGSYWFAVPGKLLLKRGAQCLGHRLVQSWRTKDPAAWHQVVETWIAEQLTRWELSPDRLLARLHDSCIPVLGQTPEAACAAVLAKWAARGPLDLTRNGMAAVKALAELERLVGVPGAHATGEPSNAALVTILDEAAAILSAEVLHQLAEVALHALSEPQFRLTGADEAFHRQLTDTLAVAVRQQRSASEKFLAQAADIHQQITPLMGIVGKSSLLWRGTNAKNAARLYELLQLYPPACCQGLIALRVSKVYQYMLENLQRYLRPVTCCRPRIEQFLQTFKDPARSEQPPTDLGLGRYLLPAGCRTLDEAAHQILARLTPEEIAELKQNVTELLRGQFQAQIHVCTATASFFKELEEAVYHEVAAFAEAQLTKAHAAELYLRQHEEDEAMLADLAGAFDDAFPELTGSSPSPAHEINILAVPPGLEGEYFRNLVYQALPDADLVAATSTDDVVFYRELSEVPLAALPQLGPKAREAYQQLLNTDQFTPHSRVDIVGWRPVES